MLDGTARIRLSRSCNITCALSGQQRRHTASFARLRLAYVNYPRRAMNMSFVNSSVSCSFLRTAP